MKKTNQFVVLETLGHTLFWTVCYWIMLLGFSKYILTDTEVGGLSETSLQVVYPYLPVLVGIIGKMIVVYANIFLLLPRFFHSKRWLELTVLNVLLILSASFIEGAIPPTEPDLKVGPSIGSSYAGMAVRLVLNILFAGLATGLFLGKKYFQNEKQKQLLSKQQLATELQFLKSQINPHFLFNTLNNLFSMSEESKNAELSKGISELSDLMRYMLYEAQERLVPLSKEIVYLQSIIGIKKLQLLETDDVTITFNVHGNTNGHKVAPLILSPFVENALKHGINLKSHSSIDIDLTVAHEHLVFEVLNTKANQSSHPMNDYSGIGLENVKRRLELIYPDQFELSIDDQVDRYHVFLKVKIDIDESNSSR